MGISTYYLPSTSPYIGYAFNQAMALVIQTPCGGIDYTLAVYNCGGHLLLKIAPDQLPSAPGQPGYTFFADKRKEYGLNGLIAGLVQSSSDESTSQSTAVPDALKQLTLGDLDFMRTPWGRNYLAHAQDYGGLFGLS